MADSTDPRVAVYLDFDNIVMSWYDRVHGRHSFSRDRQKIAADPTDPEVAERLAEATVDVGALIDHAASFGSIMLTRAYADWSAPVNADYRSQLVARAVDLVQLFPAAAYAKNGADIRLAVDTVEDCFRIPDLTHVVIVAGDSDYVPLAQRCKRLGTYVAAVGVAGSTAKSLAAACDQFDSYETLPGIELPEKPAKSRSARGGSGAKKGRGGADGGNGSDGTNGAGGSSGSDGSDGSDAPGAGSTGAESADGSGSAAKGSKGAKGSAGNGGKGGKHKGSERGGDAADGADQVEAASSDADLDALEADLDIDDSDDISPEEAQAAASRLLGRALQLGERDDTEWLHSSLVKTYMRRMDPSFSEKLLGFRSFSDFLKANDDIAELEETGHERLVRAIEPPVKQTAKRSGRRRRTS
ncbi:NYN domain-containing protein [Brachybacterium sp. ACRRE]|uniref:NYN domain-containing protein n=1 Tax=Brachybacterium sp. ACRRE TaxID=2918184 RepID=UPI001EF1A04D|nr:NYN domain-containing protein [Brachybacterium sp. ACRRE]MCG7308911.1 NYN domain-containing protein [Brachybacterium sp. ACRRE]